MICLILGSFVSRTKYNRLKWQTRVPNYFMLPLCFILKVAVALLESTRLSICTSVVFCKGILRTSPVSLSGTLTITRITGLYSSVKSRTLNTSVVVWPWNKAGHVCLSKFPVLSWPIFSSNFLIGIDFWVLGCGKATIISALQTREPKLHVMSLSPILCL